MSIETLIAEMTREEKLAAMELLWRDLVSEPESFESPAWHGKVIAERLANPSPGPNISLEEGKAMIEEQLNARRASD